jgi:short-subunit dehydrogenase
MTKLAEHPTVVHSKRSVKMTISNQEQKSIYTRYGPWAIVTGASSGIGREIAMQLGAAGLNLLLVARSQGTLQTLADELTTNQGIEVRVLAEDLADALAVDGVMAASQELDIGLLVAAAGFGTSGRFLDSSIAEELNMLDVNCRALLLLTRHFGERFANRGKGGIILMSSIVGFQGMPNAAHYAATKAYVQTLAEALYVELKPKGVDVLASAPGPTKSGFAARAGMQMGAALDPATGAQGTLRALGRTSTALPGFLSKLLVYSLATLPRMVRVRIMGQVMRGMTKHRAVSEAR